MVPANFLAELQNIVAGGNGFIRWLPLDIFTIRTSAGAAVAPIGEGNFGLKVAETEALVLTWVAGNATEIILNIVVPPDYDEDVDSDILKVGLFAVMEGGDDTPAFTAEAYLKRTGEALSSDLAPLSSAALSETPGWVFVNVSGKGLKGGDIVQVKVAPGTHANDDISLYGAAVVYRSVLTPYNVDDRR